MCLTNQNARFAYITMATRLRNRTKINLVARVLYFSDENEEQGSCMTVLQRFRRYSISDQKETEDSVTTRPSPSLRGNASNERWKWLPRSDREDLTECFPRVHCRV